MEKRVAIVLGWYMAHVEINDPASYGTPPHKDSDPLFWRGGFIYHIFILIPPAWRTLRRGRAYARCDYGRDLPAGMKDDLAASRGGYSLSWWYAKITRLAGWKKSVLVNWDSEFFHRKLDLKHVARIFLVFFTPLLVFLPIINDISLFGLTKTQLHYQNSNATLGLVYKLITAISFHGGVSSKAQLPNAACSLVPLPWSGLMPCTCLQYETYFLIILFSRE